MSTIKNESDVVIWIVCDNGVDVWLLSDLMPGGTCTTGQPNQAEYATRAEAVAAIPDPYKPKPDEA